MQFLDAITLKYLAAEWQDHMHHAKVNRVQQWARDEFVLHLWRGGASNRAEEAKEASYGNVLELPHDWNKLYINLTPQFPFCTLANTEALTPFATSELKRPTGFCMALKKYLTNARIVNVYTLPAEPVVCMVFENVNEFGNRMQVVLAIELMGKFTNMVLFDHLGASADSEQENRILAVAHPVDEEMSRYRLLSVGRSYVAPPRPAERLLLPETSEETFRERFQPVAEALCTSREVSLPGGLESSSPPSLERFGQEVTHLLWGVSTPTVQTVAEQLVSFGSSPQMAPEVSFSSPGEATQLALQFFQAFQRYDSLQPVLPTLSPRRLKTAHLPLKSARRVEGPVFRLWQEPAPNFSPPEETLPLWQAYPSVSAMVQTYCLTLLLHSRIHQVRQQLLLAIAEQEKKRLRHLKSLTPINPKTIQTLQHQGDLLLVSLSCGDLSGHKPDTSTVMVTDPETATAQKLAVVPEKTWSQNAQDYFRRARKAKAKQAVYESRLHNLKNQQTQLEELQLMVEEAANLPELEALKNDLIGAGVLKGRLLGHRKQRLQHRQKKSGKGGKSGAETFEGHIPGIWCVTSSDGFEIWVGKSAQANSLLSGKLARPKDLWFHVHQMAGAHVLLRCHPQEAEDIPNTTLEEAAMLAAYHSVGKATPNLPVVYTQSRYVRKIPGSYPGHVNYREETGVFITVDFDWIEELKQNSVV